MSAFLFSASVSLRAQLTFASGEITGAETWSGTVSVSGDVTVTSTGSLTILPGTRIEADWRSDDTVGGGNQNRVELMVAAGGVLNAQGTEAAPIVFTVYAGDPPVDVAAGDWYGVRLKSDQATLRYCTVEYGYVGISVEAGSPVIDHCRLQKNSYGVIVANGLHVGLSQSAIVDNGSSGLNGGGDGATLTLSGCAILRNDYGVNWARNLTLTATDSVISSNQHNGVLAGVNLVLTLADCEVSHNGTEGINGSNGEWSSLTASLERCRVTHNGGDGLRETYGNLWVSAAESSFSANGGKGIGVAQRNWGYTTSLALTNCQVVGNTGVGLDAFGTTVLLPVTGTVIASNQVGIVVQTQGAKVEGLSGNQLFGNVEFEIKDNGPGAVVATNNVWGEPTPTELAAGKLKLTKIYDSFWDGSVGQVLIDRPPPPQSKEGQISGSETWSGTVTMVGDVTVTGTGSLTVLPGTRIQSSVRVDSQAGGANQNRVELMVAAGGVLNAQGTEAAPIVFTVYAGDPPVDVAAGDWYGVRLKSDQATLRYCTVEYGYVGISVEAGSPVIDHCRLQKNSYGVIVANGLHVGLSQSAIVDNGSSGLNGGGDGATLTLSGCAILRNDYGVNWARNLTLTATDSVISSNQHNGVLAGVNLVLTLADCEVSHNGTEGINGSNGEWSSLTASLERCRVTHNGGDGLRETYGNLWVSAAESSFSANGGKGIGVAQRNWGYTTSLALTNCQVVGNTGVGLDAFGTTVLLPVTGTVIASNQVGIVVQTQGAKVEGLSGNQLFGNVEFEIKDNGPGAVVATNNVWGEPTPTELAAGKLKLTKIYDSFWDGSVGQVLIDRPPPPQSKEGQISGSETWSGTVTMVGDVTVTGTGSLTVLPGTRIQSSVRVDSQAGGANQNRVELMVAAGGVLNAQGTEAAPIVFTVYAGDPPVDVAAGDWYGVRLKSDQATLRYCTVEYGYVGISVEAGSPVIDHCRLQKNSYGVIVANGLHVGLSQSAIVDNGSSGLNGGGDGATLTLSGCAILRNDYGVNWARNLTLTATDSVISSNQHNGVLAGVNLVLTLADCEVSHNGTEGINGSNGEWSSLTASLERCRVTHNGGDGLRETYGNLWVSAAESSFSANGGKGIGVAQRNWGYTTSLALTNCQVVGNTGVGLDAFGTTVLLPVTGTVIASNQVGIVVQTQGAKVEGLSGNDLRNNKDFELRNNGPGAVVATNNFWGEPTTTELNNRKTNLTKIWDSKDDATLGQVVVKPFSDECFACSLPPSVEISPALVVTVPGRDVTFTANATGTNPMSYEWQKWADPVWVPISGATTAILELSEVAFADSGRYRVVVSNLSGTGIAEVTLTVADDNEPPTVVRAVGLDGASVALFFNEALDPQSATNASNYAAGPSQTVSSLALSADQQTVFLGLSGPAPAGLQITFQGVADAIGNPASGSASVVNFTSADIGNPGQAGSARLIDGAGVEASGGGTDLGGEADSFQYLYTTITGDFDVRVRVADLTNTDPWAKAGLLVRESLAPGSRHYANLATPADGKNVNFVQFRLADGQTALLPNELWRPCNYPNNWLRIQRTGMVVRSYVSGDGVTWIDLHQLDTTGAPYPDTVYVGLATTAHNDATRATARYADVYLQFAPPTSLPTIEITKSETGLTISWSKTYTSFVLQSTPDLAPPAWTDITEGISSVGDKFTKPVDPVGERAFYRLIQR